jgi:xanthine dehydrogenase molybdopterin-binding subunit B
MKTVQVVLTKKATAQSLGSFKVSGSAADEAKTGTQLLPVIAAMYWVVHDESVSFENIMVKETRWREVKYFVETA